MRRLPLPHPASPADERSGTMCPYCGRLRTTLTEAHAAAGVLHDEHSRPGEPTCCMKAITAYRAIHLIPQPVPTCINVPCNCPARENDPYCSAQCYLEDHRDWEADDPTGDDDT